MPRVQLENGKILEFDKDPTPEDIDFAIQQMGKKKEAWKIQTPEELVKQGMSPTMAGLTATGQQLSSPAYKYGNMLLGGLPNIALGKMGYEAPTSPIRMATPFGEKDISGIANTAANVGGFVRGLPMKAAGAVARAIPAGASLMGRVGLGALKGATQYGLASGLHTPEGQFENWKGRAGRTGMGAAGGAVAGAASGLVSHFTSLLSESALLKTGEETRAGFKGFKDKLTTWFGNKLSKYQARNPNQKVDLTEELKKFDKGLGDKSKFKSLLNSSPRLRKAITQKNLSLPETQELVNQLKNTVSENMLAGFKVRPSNAEVLDFIGSIQKAKQTAFPAMKMTDAVYGKMSQYANATENYMKYGKTVEGLKTMVRNPEMKKSLKTLLPDDLFKKIVQTVQAKTITKAGLNSINFAVRSVIVYSLIRDMVNKIDFNTGDTSDGSGGD